MTRIPAAPTQRWLMVAAIGTGLWLFLTAAHRLLALVPAIAPDNAEWERSISFQFPLLADLAVAIALTVLLLLMQRFDAPRARRPLRAVLPAVIAVAVTMAEAGRAGLLALGLVRAFILAIGVIGATYLLDRFVRPDPSLIQRSAQL